MYASRNRTVCHLSGVMHPSLQHVQCRSGALVALASAVNLRWVPYRWHPAAQVTAWSLDGPDPSVGIKVRFELPPNVKCSAKQR